MADLSQSDITRILTSMEEEGGDRRAAVDLLFDATYAELRRLAARLMHHERSGHTLQPTALVHEAYVRLADASAIDWKSRAQFLAIAARAMRQLLIDHARRRAAARREGGWKRVTLDPELALTAGHDVDLLRFEDVLTQLTEKDERMARVVELRVFGGLKIAEVSQVLDVSPRTVNKDWCVAKMWFTRALADSET